MNLDFEQNPFLKFLKKIFVYLLIIYVFVLLARSVMVNVGLKKQIDQVKKTNQTLEANNKNLQNLIVYYQSASFKELEARDKLGLKKPDEQVVFIPVKKFDQTNNSVDQIAPVKPQNISNFQAWWQYIFE